MPLLTAQIEADLQRASRLLDRPPGDTLVIVKLFTPDASATWFITEGEQLEDGDWRLFGFCDLGDPQCAELGYVLLSEIEAVRGAFGLPVERDLHYSGTLADVLSAYGR